MVVAGTAHVNSSGSGGVRLVAEDENRYGEAQCDAARDQEMHQPLGSDQASRDHNH